MKSACAVASRLLGLLGANLILSACAHAPPQSPAASISDAGLSDWPRVASPYGRDPLVEARIQTIVASMTLEQKVGQMTLPDVLEATPEDVRRYCLGGILNGANSQPDGSRRASFAVWRALSARYHAAALATDLSVKIPLLWGTDAVHGHGIVFGATIFPHNVGLGAAHDSALLEAIGHAVASQVRATGIDWVFAPTLAVVQNYRWGRSYESYSSDPTLVRDLGAAYVRGLQDGFPDGRGVVATAKHFIGDGGTAGGVDQGINLATHRQMIDMHAQGYIGALGAGVQTVMVSYSSWNDVADNRNYGKMHGSRSLLTDVLKSQMGFDGFVVSDWNGIAQVPGCEKDHCARAVNAGIDMFMVPEKWKSFIRHTAQDVRDGKIPLARIDDAVTRILRVKMRAGLFEGGADRSIGDESALQARELARRAVRESLVLLKNNDAALPLRRGMRVLVVGKSADSLRNQNGGWSMSWQGVKNTNADFPAGDTVLAALRATLGTDHVAYREAADAVNIRELSAWGVDAVVAVIGELPSAEMLGDIAGVNAVAASKRYPEDLAVLRKASGFRKPVVTVLLSGRPLYANDLLNESDAFVAAWLPGTEGKGISDLIVADEAGRPAYDFKGALAFAWPRSPCGSAIADADDLELFARGYGLTYANAARLDTLPAPSARSGCSR